MRRELPMPYPFVQQMDRILSYCLHQAGRIQDQLSRTHSMPEEIVHVQRDELVFFLYVCRGDRNIAGHCPQDDSNHLDCSDRIYIELANHTHKYLSLDSPEHRDLTQFETLPIEFLPTASLAIVNSSSDRQAIILSDALHQVEQAMGLYAGDLASRETIKHVLVARHATICACSALGIHWSAISSALGNRTKQSIFRILSKHDAMLACYEDYQSAYYTSFDTIAKSLHDRFTCC